MKYTYDTEFLENGNTIELISIGIVAEDGREFYAVNADMRQGRIRADDWLLANVWPHLPTVHQPTAHVLARHQDVLDTSAACVKPKWVIANEVRDFLLAKTGPELWAYYGAYDHVSLAWLFGPMKDMPAEIPFFTHEIMQAIEAVPGFKLPPASDTEHNALADARWNREVLRQLGIFPTN
jgi:3' exoribonuclease, RNase T-like